MYLATIFISNKHILVVKLILGSSWEDLHSFVLIIVYRHCLRQVFMFNQSDFLTVVDLPRDSCWFIIGNLTLHKQCDGLPA